MNLLFIKVIFPPSLVDDIEGVVPSIDIEELQRKFCTVETDLSFHELRGHFSIHFFLNESKCKLWNGEKFKL